MPAARSSMETRAGCVGQSVNLIQLPVNQQNRGQEIEGVLFAHVPLDLRVVGLRVADCAVELLRKIDESVLLPSLCLH